MAEADTAARLRKIRQKRRKSQRGIASDVGVSEATWQRMEKGAVPTGETLLGVAKLGYSPTWVLLGRGPMMLAELEGEPASVPEAPVVADRPEPLHLADTLDAAALEAAFREALAARRVPASAAHKPGVLMALTLALHDARAQREAEAAPRQPAGLVQLYGRAKPDWLAQAFRDALGHGGLPAEPFGDIGALIILTMLLYDTRTQRTAEPTTTAISEI